MIELLLAAATAAVLARSSSFKWWMAGALSGIITVATDWSILSSGMEQPWWWPSMLFPWVPIVSYTEIAMAFAIGAVVGSAVFFVFRRILK